MKEYLVIGGEKSGAIYSTLAECDSRPLLQALVRLPCILELDKAQGDNDDDPALVIKVIRRLEKEINLRDIGRFVKEAVKRLKDLHVLPHRTVVYGLLYGNGVQNFIGFDPATIVQITGNKNPRLVVFPSTVHAIIWNLAGGNKSLALMGLDEWKGHVAMDPAPLPRRVITVPDDSDHEGDIEMKSETEKSDGGSAAAEDAFKSMGKPRAKKKGKKPAVEPGSLPPPALPSSSLDASLEGKAAQYFCDVLTRNPSTRAHATTTTSVLMQALTTNSPAPSVKRTAPAVNPAGDWALQMAKPTKLVSQGAIARVKELGRAVFTRRRQPGLAPNTVTVTAVYVDNEELVEQVQTANPYEGSKLPPLAQKYLLCHGWTTEGFVTMFLTVFRIQLESPTEARFIPLLVEEGMTVTEAQFLFSLTFPSSTQW